MCLAVGLMVADHRFEDFRRVRSLLSVTALPIQYLVDWPARWVNWASIRIATQHQLLVENAKLRANQLLLEAKLQKLLALERENAHLRGLLQSAPHAGGKFTVAQLLAVEMNPLVQQVILDKGKHAGIYVGQPVLDAYGVMGQVIETGPVTSRVMLVSALQSAIPVQDARNGIRAIATGRGYNNEMQLLYVPETTDVHVGDVLVTSGLGGRFPEGYPVGIIKSVTRNPQFRFLVVRVTPAARLDRSRQVLLVWPAHVKDGRAPAATPAHSPHSPAAKSPVKEAKRG